MTQATPNSLPALGASFEGGKYAGLLTDKEGKPYILVLLPDRGEDLKWPAATAWADGLGASLPNRLECALLFQNLRSDLRPEWHWTNEEHESDASYAWYCTFYDGYQGFTHKSAEGAAVAVRRLPLESFNPFEGHVARIADGSKQIRAAVEALTSMCDLADATASELVSA